MKHNARFRFLKSCKASTFKDAFSSEMVKCLQAMLERVFVVIRATHYRLCFSHIASRLESVLKVLTGL